MRWADQPVNKGFWPFRKMTARPDTHPGVTAGMRKLTSRPYFAANGIIL